MAQTGNKGALDGIRVLDLSRVLAGPWATQNLADLGAEVIKVERPGVGDDTRQWGPPFYTQTDGQRGDAAYYMTANRNKSSVTIDFSKPQGQTLIHKLAAMSDVVVENFRTGHLARYNLDYDSLRALKPDLIYCSFTGFGQTGPLKDHAGYDYLIQAMSGLMSVTGEKNGPAVKVGIAEADLYAGLYAANAILAALIHAGKTGEGQHIDVSLLDCQMAVMTNQAAGYLLTGENPERMGTRHPNLVPYQTYACSDGDIVIAIANDGQFARFCTAVGLGGLEHDARFAINAARVENRDALDTLLIPLIAERPVICWLEALAAVGVPCGPLNTVAQALADPQVIARGMIDDMKRDDLRQPVRVTAAPVKLSKTPSTVRKAPPALGADTNVVLHDMLSLTELDIARLRKDGII